MAENVGGIVWTAEMKTELLVSAQKIVESSMAASGAAFEKAAKKSEQASKTIESSSKAASDAVKSSSTEIKAAQQSLASATKALSDRYTSAQSKLKEFVTQQVAAGRSLDENGNVTTSAGVRAAKLSDEYNKLRIEFQAASKQVDSVNNVIQKLARTTEELKAETASAAPPTKELAVALSAQEVAADTLATKYTQSAKALNDFIAEQVQAGGSISKTGQVLNSAGAEVTEMTARLNHLTTGYAQSKTQVDAVNAAFMRQTKTAAGVGGAFGGLRGQASNLGYQLQDIAVQAQMGTNWLTIIGQQGSQFLGGLGPAGALAGAGLAVLAASLSVLAPTMMNSKKSSEQLEKSMESLGGVTIQTENSVSVLTKEIEALYAVSKEAALAQVISGLVTAKNATKEAGSAIREEFGKIDGSFGPFGTSIDEAIIKLDSINQRTKDFGTVSRKEISDQSAVYQDFGEKLGAVGGAAETLGFNVISALSQLKKTGDVQAFQTVFASLVNQYGASNVKLAEFNAKLTEFFSKARSAAEATKFLDGAYKDLDATLSKAGESTEPVIRSLTQQLELQKVALKDGAVAAELLSAAFSLGKTSAEQLPPTIRALITEINKLKNNTIITELEMQEAQLRMTGNEYELYAAKQSAALAGATPEIIAAIEARIKGLQDLRLGLEAVSDQEAEDEKKRQAGADRQSKVDELTKEIQLQQIRNSLGNDQFEIQSAINALGKNAKPEDKQQIASLVAQMQALRYEADLLGPSLRESFNDVTLGALDDFSSGLARVITEGDSAREMFGNLAKTIATELLTAIIRYWVGQAAAALVGQTAVTGATVAAGGAAAAAWAPAATLASIATLGGAATVGVAALGTGLTAGVGLAAATQTGSALAMGPGRLSGGPVYPGMMHPVTEDGNPELLTMAGQSYLLPGSRGGEVTSFKDMQKVGAGGGGNTVVNVINNSTNTQVQETRRQGADRSEVIDIIVSDLQKRGAVHKAVTNTTNAVNRTS